MMEKIPEFKTYGFQKEDLAAKMRQNGLKAVLLTSPENVYYTTGYTVLPSSGNPILFTLRKLFPFFSFIRDDGLVSLGCWDFSALGVQFGADQVLGFPGPEEGKQALRDVFTQNLTPGCKLGIETSFPYQMIQILNETVPGVELVVVDEYLIEQRLVKSAKEIELSRTSTRIIEETLLDLCDKIHVGMSRLTLIQEAKAALYKRGATGLSHTTFNFGKANPEIAIGDVLTPDQLVTLDLGGIYEGYASDNRRYAYSGEVPVVLLEHYEKMVAIVDGVGSALKPGVSYAYLFQLGKELFTQYGIDFDKNPFNHVGHNMGLETEEDWLGDDPNHFVKVGMVINVELYSIAPTGDFIGDEETYVIEENSPTRISILPRIIARID